MKTFLIPLAISLTISMGLCASTVQAQGKSNSNRADKVTGTYSVVVGSGLFHAQIEAHEATATKPVRGSFFWVGERNGQEYCVLGSVYDAVISGNEAVVFVQVDTVINATHIPPNGTFVYRVVDGGTPGRNGDTMELTWLTGTNAQWGPVPVVSGNLKVHSND